MADTAEPGAGTITIELDGKEHQMVPTLAACMAISSIAGGLNAAVQKCLQLDFNTICAFVQAGLGLNPTQSKMVPEAVYKTGTMTLSGPCIDFINIVANGGRPIVLDDDEGAGEGAEADPLRPASP